jgi:molecular chaperone DnaK
MEVILGIDLGTTNSVASILRDGKAVVLEMEGASPILPSAVGIDSDGGLLVGTPAKNQALLAPERTILSVKRLMGEDTQLTLGDRQVTPQEVSAIILRTLKERAEAQLGQPIHKAVITVPAFFKENQRAATKQAGELAGLEVVRIINEPTAAALCYRPEADVCERLLVYDLGGGTFDVSIVQVERGVVEVLSSHGDTHLGGDDFDQLLLDHVIERFRKEVCDVDLRANPSARSRLLQTVESGKRRLSDVAFTSLEEAFLATHEGNPVHLNMVVERSDYEELIMKLLEKTITCVDAALDDAKLLASNLDKIILVGGASRTPMVRQLLKNQLDHDPHLELDPDLCVSLGAAIQGALIQGEKIGTILVDITPHTLGISCLGFLNGMYSPNYFAPIIHRNSSLPVSRSELFYTSHDGQERAEFCVYQGEHEDATLNELIGTFQLEDLVDKAAGENDIEVRFDLDLNGTLKVTALERATSRQNHLTIDSAITRFKAGNQEEARRKLADWFKDEGSASEGLEVGNDAAVLGDSRYAASVVLLEKAARVEDYASEKDGEEIKNLTEQLRAAIAAGTDELVERITAQLEDIIFYLEDA